MQPIENNAKYFTRLVGNQVRFTVPPCYRSWTEVPQEQRARLCSIIEERSSKNKANRGEANNPSVQGSKSFSATRYDEFSGDLQNDDPRFAMYKAQLRRMQRKIELLKNSIRVVVPEEDSNEDADEGLEDL
ncbi:hypothetical protein Adt_44643 [Abeliophyllum distichum]|uniref:Uncharacterized protein n=1 Tax=Abeliophyllum distichum TaxID=126358 RepID=A0ABD1PBG3_9LAMI